MIGRIQGQASARRTAVARSPAGPPARPGDEVRRAVGRSRATRSIRRCDEARAEVREALDEAARRRPRGARRGRPGDPRGRRRHPGADRPGNPGDRGRRPSLRLPPRPPAPPRRLQRPRRRSAGIRAPRLVSTRSPSARAAEALLTSADDPIVTGQISATEERAKDEARTRARARAHRMARARACPGPGSRPPRQIDAMILETTIKPVVKDYGTALRWPSSRSTSRPSGSRELRRGLPPRSWSSRRLVLSGRRSGVRPDLPGGHLRLHPRRRGDQGLLHQPAADAGRGRRRGGGRGDLPDGGLIPGGSEPMIEFLVFRGGRDRAARLLLGLLQVVAPQSPLHEGLRRRLGRFKLWHLMARGGRCRLALRHDHRRLAIGSLSL